VLEHKYQQGLLGRWAAGASRGEKSAEQVVEEKKLKTLKTWRGSVIEYLRKKLLETGEVQREMMERRLGRELEKGRSVLYKVKGVPDLDGHSGEGKKGSLNGLVAERSAGSGGYRGVRGAAEDDETRQEIEQQLSPEQLQLFAQENQDLLNHYNDTLDQVRHVFLFMVLLLYH